MRKAAILCLIVAMVFGITGATCLNSVLNSGPVGFMCSPTPEQQATAAAMLAALDAAQAAGAMFFPVLGIAKASAVLRVIVGGGCFVISELKSAFDAVDAANAAVAQAQLGKLKGATPALPEYRPLRVLVK